MIRAWLVLGLLAIALVGACSSADIAVEKKAAADANARINQYCDARSKALQSLEFDGGEAGAKGK